MTDRTQHIDYEAAVRARGGFWQAASVLLSTAYRSEGAESATAAVAAHACEVAEQAIFDALNALSSYVHDQEAGRVLYMREWEPEQTFIGMPIVPDPRMPKNRSTIFGGGESGAGSPPAFVTESVERCVDEVERAVSKIPAIASARVGVVHGTSDGGWRVECRIDNQVFAPRFDTLDKAQDYRNAVAEILDRAT